MSEDCSAHIVEEEGSGGQRRHQEPLHADASTKCAPREGPDHGRDRDGRVKEELTN